MEVMISKTILLHQMLVEMMAILILPIIMYMILVIKSLQILAITELKDIASHFSILPNHAIF